MSVADSRARLRASPIVVSLLALVGAGAPAAAALTTRVSVSSAGAEADGASDCPALSADGRYVAFRSQATNLVPGDTNGVADVFVHDRVTHTTTRVSVASDGTQGDGAAGCPAISGDGHYAAFGSAASNLVAGDTNGAQDVFVRDVVAGTTTRVTDLPVGSTVYAVALNGDGRYVLFSYYASQPPAPFSTGTLVADTQTSTLRQLDSSNAYGWLALSNDGRCGLWQSDGSCCEATSRPARRRSWQCRERPSATWAAL
jgi:hypothetical protein